MGYTPLTTNDNFLDSGAYDKRLLRGGPRMGAEKMSLVRLPIAKKHLIIFPSTFYSAPSSLRSLHWLSKYFILDSKSTDLSFLLYRVWPVIPFFAPELHFVTSSTAQFLDTYCTQGSNSLIWFNVRLDTRPQPIQEEWQVYYISVGQEEH